MWVFSHKKLRVMTLVWGKTLWFHPLQQCTICDVYCDVMIVIVGWHGLVGWCWFDSWMVWMMKCLFTNIVCTHMCRVRTKDQNRAVLGMKVRCEAGIKHGTRILTNSYNLSIWGPYPAHNNLIEFDFQNGWLSLILEERMHLTHEVP
jgi:hypothetical protein